MERAGIFKNRDGFAEGSGAKALASRTNERISSDKGFNATTHKDFQVSESFWDIAPA
jgi:hypothetical protein